MAQIRRKEGKRSSHHLNRIFYFRVYPLILKYFLHSGQTSRLRNRQSGIRWKDNERLTNSLSQLTRLNMSINHNMWSHSTGLVKFFPATLNLLKNSAYISFLEKHLIYCWRDLDQTWSTQITNVCNKLLIILMWFWQCIVVNMWK